MIPANNNNSNTNTNNNNSSSSSDDQEPMPVPECELPVKIGPNNNSNNTPVTTPLSLVVSNLSQQQQLSACSPACLHEKRIIRRELQKWGKNVVYLVGFESVAQEFLGPRRWKRMTLGLPCPPVSSVRFGDRLGKLRTTSEHQSSAAIKSASPSDQTGTCAVISDEVGPMGGEADSGPAAIREGPVEPVDWDPEKDDCLNCALKKSQQQEQQQQQQISFLQIKTEVPDSTEVVSSMTHDPVVRQSNENICSCGSQKSCVSCLGLTTSSPVSSDQNDLQRNGRGNSSHSPDREIQVKQETLEDSMQSSALLNKISSHNARLSDQATSSSQKMQQKNPNYHLLLQLKKQLILPSINSSTNPSCDQPLDLSLNSTRAVVPVAHSSSSLLSETTTAIPKGPFDQNSLLKVAPATDDVTTAGSKRTRETTWKRNYTEEELNQALEDIMGGKLGTRRAAVIYGIPRSTLRNKVYKLGKGSPVGPGRLPGRRPKSATTAAATSAKTSLSTGAPQVDVASDKKLSLLENGPLSALASGMMKKEPQVIPKTRVGRKSMKTKNKSEAEEGSNSIIMNNNNNNSNIDSSAKQKLSQDAVSSSASLLNSPFMSFLPLMMLNANQFTGAPDVATTDPLANMSQTSSLFNQQQQSQVAGDQLMIAHQQSANQQQQQVLPMLSTLDPAAVSAIAPLIYSYLLNFERLFLASTAASAASASLSATATTLSTGNPKPIPTSTSTTAVPIDYSSAATNSDPFLLEYFEQLRGTTSDPTSSDLLTSASAQRNHYQQQEGPDDVSGDDEEESDFADVIDCREDLKVDPVVLKIPPSLKSKKSSLNNRTSELGNKSSDVVFDCNELPPRSLLERNLLSFTSNRSNSYASSINSEESNGDQSVTSAGKKSSRTGSSGSSSKRSNGSKGAKAIADNDASGIKNRPKRGRYRNYDKEALDKAVQAVQSGEMSVHRAGTFYGVPHSTLEYKVKQRHLLREKKRPATSNSAIATPTAASSNNSSASSPPGEMSASPTTAHPVPSDQEEQEPEEKKFRLDDSFVSLNDL